MEAFYAYLADLVRITSASCQEVEYSVRQPGSFEVLFYVLLDGSYLSSLVKSPYIYVPRLSSRFEFNQSSSFKFISFGSLVLLSIQ